MVDFHTIALPSAPAARAAASGTASGRAPRGGPSPGRLLASSLKIIVGATRHSQHILLLAANTILFCFTRGKIISSSYKMAAH